MTRPGPRDPAPRPGMGPTLADAARRSLGLLLIVLVAIPAFRTLDEGELMSRLMRGSAIGHWRFTWAGLALALAAAVVLGQATRGRIVRWVDRSRAAVERLPRRVVATAAALLGAGLVVRAAFAVFDLRTVLNDASVQLVQARYFAAGRLAGPPLDMPEFWTIQFMVQTPEGWVAQYPPGHAALLAAGFLAGAPWIATAAAMALMGALLVASFDRLFPERRAEARLAALLAATSPLLIGLAAGYMSHATVAALAALALYLGLRAEGGGIGWAAAAGAAVGAMVLTRPVTGALIGLVVGPGLWLTSRDPRSPAGRKWLLSRLPAWVGGGVPFAVAFGWFNARFFGSPLRLGYVAASGPNHGLGFHEDPWGRMYGPADAVGHTSAELVALGRELLGTPIPLVAAIGLFLLLTTRLDRGERIVLAWATLPVLASALYWHHDLVFGPRMLGEAAPAWCALAVLAAVGLTRGPRGASWRDAVALVFLLGLGYAAVVGAPGRLGRYEARLGPAPPVEAPGPSLVFVHETWADRLGGRLAARGFRLDSVRTLLGRYPPCRLQAGLEGLEDPSAAEAVCRREQAADRYGAVGLTSLLWTGDLPGLAAEGPLYARDLGPGRNGALIARHPERVPLFLLPPGVPGGARIVPYAEGLGVLWSGTGPAPPSGVARGSNQNQ